MAAFVNFAWSKMNFWWTVERSSWYVSDSLCVGDSVDDQGFPGSTGDSRVNTKLNGVLFDFNWVCVLLAYDKGWADASQ